MTCLTEVVQVANYSCPNKTSIRDLNSMKTKYTEPESPSFTFKNEFARQRWELFHRAIGYAKQTNEAALVEADVDTPDAPQAAPRLTLVR